MERIQPEFLKNPQKIRREYNPCSYRVTMVQL